jgi:hypothetical protein
MDNTAAQGRAEAYKAYRIGEGLDDNPFPKRSQAHEAYQWEMHRLQLAELKGLEQEMRAGV